MADQLSDENGRLANIRGRIFFDRPRLEGLRVRLILQPPDQSRLVAEDAVGADGLFNLHYPADEELAPLRVEVVDAEAADDEQERVLLTHPIPEIDPEAFWEVTPEGVRGLPPTEILPPPIATDPWRNSYPVEPEQVQRSKEATSRIFQAYDAGERGIGGETTAYPWRYQVSSATRLPAFLRARLASTPPPDQTAEAIRAYVGSTDFTSALFGADLSEKFDQVFRPQTPVSLAAAPGSRAIAENRHFTWQQFYTDAEGHRWPVLGGSFRVHHRSGSRNLGTTNSYFPIEDGALPPAPAFSDAALFETALGFLLFYVRGRNALSLLLAYKKLEWERRTPRLRRILAWLLALLSGGKRVKRFVTWKRVDYSIDSEGSAGATSRLAVLPYGGRYHLTARVRVALGNEEVWYVDVDVHQMTGVGTPWQPASHGAYFESSLDAAAETPGGDFPNPRLKIEHEPTPPLLDISPGPSLERVTVAVHGYRFYTHLTTICGTAPQFAKSLVDEPGLAFRVFLESDRPSQFVYDNELSSKEIHLQRDLSADVVLGNQPPIHHPARDPELIVHELCHAFFYLLNRQLWQEPQANTPFVRALHEGYAIYMARSLFADLGDGQGELPWASAVYRPNEWPDRWLLRRDSCKLGADLLHKPNNFPQLKVNPADIDFQVDYDVGMIWARALWDVRQLLGGEATDYLAVQAYPYLHGAIVNLQSAAEALIEADARANQQFNVAAAVEPIWGIRGLISEMGVFCFAQSADDRLFAGTDRGIRFWDGQNWLEDTAATPDGALASIDSLAAIAHHIFAIATPPRNKQDGEVLSWNAGLFVREDDSWHAIPTPPDITPLGVYALEGELFLTTTQGVFRKTADGWESITAENRSVGHLLLWQSNGSKFLTGALSTRVGRMKLSAAGPQSWGKFSLATDSRPSALAVWKEHLYAGSLEKGLWCLAPNSGAFKFVLDVDAILALTATEDRLIWSTPAGLFWKKWSTDTAVDWSETSTLRSIAPPCPAAMIVSLWAHPSGELVAGTLAHGIWHCNLADQKTEWHSQCLPPTAAEVEIASHGSALVSYFHKEEDPAAPVIDIPGVVTVEKIAQPGFPLHLRTPNQARQVGLTAGWVILLLRNHADHTVTITASRGGGGGIQVQLP